MLVSMHIENIAVIKRLDLDFFAGFTVLTGETGAGKSIIIDSIGLLTGAKTDRELIRTGERNAMVSACFSVDEAQKRELAELGVSPDEEGMLFLQRSVTAEGKSVSRLNGRAVPLSLHRQIGEMLVGIHGQHDSEKLMRPAAHIDWLDSYAHTDELLTEYSGFYQKMLLAGQNRDKCRLDERAKAQRLDMLRYQIEDIESADLETGEEEKLVTEKKVLQNAKQLTKQVVTVYRALYRNEKGMPADKLMEIAKSALLSLTDVMPEASAFVDRISDMQYELGRIAQRTAALMPPSGSSPEKRIEEIDDRLDQIRRLKRKYGADETEVLNFLANAKAELNEILLSDEKEKEYDRQYHAFRKSAEEAALRLSERRRAAAAELSERICGELAYLDMEKVAFSARVSRKSDMAEAGKQGESKEGNLPCRLGPKGMDEVEFMISTNPGEPLKPLAKIASGGELSRIMLAIKCVLTAAERVPTLIFDEIDTGVSGRTSQKIGMKLRALACGGPQVFCITHSAQVAANGHRQYKIIKQEVDGRAQTTVTPLDRNERIAEIARIMGGMDISQKILDSATEMIEKAETLA